MGLETSKQRGTWPSESLESCRDEEPAAVFPTTTLVVLYSAPFEELPSHYTHFQEL